MEETNFVIDERQPRPQMASVDDGQLIVKDSAQGDMLSMGKWMKTIGIIGMIISGVTIFNFIIYLLAGMADRGTIDDGLFTIILFIILSVILLIFFLSKKLFSAGKGYLNAVNYANPTELENAISNQNVYFIICGIVTVIFAILWVILNVVGLFRLLQAF